jgi:septin family protein
MKRIIVASNRNTKSTDLTRDDIRELKNITSDMLYEAYDAYNTEGLSEKDISQIVLEHVQNAIHDSSDQYSLNLVTHAKKATRQFKDIVAKYVFVHYDDYEWTCLV